ncbi:MAG: hypothetical protein JJE17_00095 [Peptostreptococcaceae bacterium]|nr:hypothetical protein [Peptostreptococcaceae bacterium]
MDSKYTKYMDNSTKLLLEELSEEYSERIIEYIVDIKRISIEDIKMRDIVQADENLMRNIDRRSENKERYKRLLTGMGMLYAFLGVSLIIFDNYRFDFSQLTQFGLIITMAGLLISIMSYGISSLKVFERNSRKNRSTRISDNNIIFISNWSVLENEARNLLITRGTQEITNIRHLFEELHKIKIFNDDDLNEVLNLIRMRNKLVHSVEGNYSNEEIRESLNKIDYLIMKLRK